jgi:uncharacterized LabA/DUF88 family protein
MARLAIFIDGGYLDVLARDEFHVRVDNAKLSAQITRVVAEETAEPVDLLRTYYYDCLPYQSNPATEEEKLRLGRKEKRFNALRNLDSYVVREGRLMYRGLDEHGKPIFQQKRVDLLLGLDFALLSGKKQITHAAIVSGDSDLIPAVEVAQQEGISTWLFHGPHLSYARELWTVSDRRFEMTQGFMDLVSMSPPR